MSMRLESSQRSLGNGESAPRNGTSVISPQKKSVSGSFSAHDLSSRKLEKLDFL